MSEIPQRGYASRKQSLSVAQLCFKDRLKEFSKDQEASKRLQGSPESRTSSQNIFFFSDKPVNSGFEDPQK